jgi:hypothetical protein
VFNVAPTSTTHYTLYAQTEEGCVTSVANAAVVTVYPAVSPGEITTDTKTTYQTANPGVTIASLDDATGGNGNIIYEWRRAGSSTATLTGSAATYTLSSDATGNYWAVGTYYFNRYAKDLTCNTEWVAATGTYTLVVETIPVIHCTQCCYNGASWVDCDVTAYIISSGAYADGRECWAGYGYNTFNSGATSAKDGRANTNAIASYATASAVGVCKALGTGWYLPAYYELYAMSSGAANPKSNNRAGAGILTSNASFHNWSSTECNGAGLSGIECNTYHAVIVTAGGAIRRGQKSADRQQTRCAWRP